MTSHAWKDEWREHASKLADDGWSASQIAEDLNVKFRLNKTRNSIIGALFRMGKALHGRESAKSRARRSTEMRIRWRAEKPKAPPPPKVASKQKLALQKVFAACEPLPPLQETDVGRVHIYDLEPKHCRWPVGEPKVGMFCGNERIEGLSYCRHHSARAYAPPNVKIYVPPTREMLMEPIEEVQTA